jgi:3-phosphoglycerate kinase
MLKMLLEQGADIILVGHNGRATPKDSRKSVEATAKFFQAQFPDTSVKFYPKYFHDDGLPLTSSDLTKDPAKKGPGSISILENIRYGDEEKPVGNEKREQFGRLLTSLADIYIVDAFADMDSKGVTMEDLPGLFVQAGKQIFIGPSMVKESKALSAALKNGVKAVISGAEKEEKLGPVQDILKGGRLAPGGFVLLGSSPSLRLNKPEEQGHLLNHNTNVFKAEDFVDTGDIGPETIKLFLDKLNTLKIGDTVLVQGILGWAENREHPEYENGTRIIWQKLAQLANERGVHVLFAGGSGVLYATKYHMNNIPNVVFVTAGGVTNKILAGRSLVGVEAFRKAMANAAMAVRNPDEIRREMGVLEGQMHALIPEIIRLGIANSETYPPFARLMQQHRALARELEGVQARRQVDAAMSSQPATVVAEPLPNAGQIFSPAEFLEAARKGIIKPGEKFRVDLTPEVEIPDSLRGLLKDGNYLTGEFIEVAENGNDISFRINGEKYFIEPHEIERIVDLLSPQGRKFITSFDHLQGPQIKAQAEQWENDPHLTWNDLKSILATEDYRHNRARQAAILLLTSSQRRKLITSRFEASWGGIWNIVSKHTERNTEQSYFVRRDSFLALGEMNLEEALPVLIDGMLYRKEEGIVRRGIVTYLKSNLDSLDSEVRPLLKAALEKAVDNDTDWYVRSIAREAVHMLDAAQSSALERHGGIDLNGRHLQMDVSGDSPRLHFDPSMIAQFERGDFSGVRPQIISIRPILDVRSLLLG